MLGEYRVELAGMAEGEPRNSVPRVEGHTPVEEGSSRRSGPRRGHRCPSAPAHMPAITVANRRGLADPEAILGLLI